MLCKLSARFPARFAPMIKQTMNIREACACIHHWRIKRLTLHSCIRITDNIQVDDLSNYVAIGTEFDTLMTLVPGDTSNSNPTFGELCTHCNENS